MHEKKSLNTSEAKSGRKIGLLVDQSFRPLITLADFLNPASQQPKALSCDTGWT
jgi:hypothetical protein